MNLFSRRYLKQFSALLCVMCCALVTEESLAASLASKISMGKSKANLERQKLTTEKKAVQIKSKTSQATASTNKSVAEVMTKPASKNQLAHKIAAEKRAFQQTASSKKSTIVAEKLKTKQPQLTVEPKPVEKVAPEAPIEKASIMAMVEKKVTEQQALQTENTETEAGKTLRLQAEDPNTGKAANIDINSESLHYDPETGVYNALGEVYIVVPEESLEVLADKATYNTKTGTLLATGHVFILRDGNVISSTRAYMDTNKNFSFYENPKTITEFFKMQAQGTKKLDGLTVIEKGRIILDKKMLRQAASSLARGRIAFGNGAQYSTFSAAWARKYLINSGLSLFEDINIKDDHEELGLSDIDPENTLKVENKTISPRDVESADYSETGSKFKIKVKEIDITKLKKEGFDEIVFKGVTPKIGNFPVGYFPKAEVGFEEKNNYIAYLGPEFGYDLDNGGYFAGPGFDMQAFNGWLKLVPFLTYGQGRRTAESANNPDLVSAQPGIGGELSYLSRNTLLRAGYNTTLNAPRLFAEQRLFGRRQTRARFAMNRVVNNGFYGSERPHWIGEIRDNRRWSFWDRRLILDTYSSAGIAEDEFFPTGQSVFFARPTSQKPITTFRGQFQANLRTGRPIIQIKDYLAVGALARLRASYYGTGDHLLVAQAGPYANLTLGPFFTNATYLTGTTSGESPFVFDSFIAGRNNLRLTNSLDITKYFTFGIQHNMNLSRDNARNDLVIGRQVFFTAGPEAMKFSFGYDVIQKRSFFGFTINPEGGNLIMNFDKINYFDPGYAQAEGPLQPDFDVLAPQEPTFPNGN